MNKWLIGLVSSLACLLMLMAGLTILLCVMYSISLTPAYLKYMPIAIPLAVGGFWMLHTLDKKL